MEKTISKSFRLPQTDVSWLQEMAKSSGITQTEIVSKCISSAKLNNGKSIALNVMNGGGVAEDNEALEVLTQLGISTASGIAGYHISGWIRKQLEMDEDKGTQVLFGMIAGLGTLILQAYHANKK
jgi:hypothetical protein